MAAKVMVDIGGSEQPFGAERERERERERECVTGEAKTSKKKCLLEVGPPTRTFS